jgi:hypothetical protein
LASTGAIGANSVQVIASVVADNGVDPTGAPTDCATGPGAFSTVSSMGFNFQSGESCSFSMASDEHGDPRLGPISDPRDGVPMRRPLPDSPLVDVVPLDLGICMPHDQRGVGRPQGSGCDIGAVEALVAELQPLSLIVDTSTDTTDAVPGDGHCVDAAGTCSLRAAMQETNRFPTPDLVTIAAGVHPQLSIVGLNENNAATGDLDVRDRLTIDGGGATIDGAGIDRVLDVYELGAHLTLRDATVTGGHAWVPCDSYIENDFDDSSGGGLRIHTGARLDRVTVTGNRASGGWAPYGGGIGTWEADTVITRSAILNNTATRDATCGSSSPEGGGVGVQEGILRIEQSLVAGNTAELGGGLSQRGALVDVVASTVVDNRADAVGAGLLSYDDTLARQGRMTVRGSLIARNDCGDPTDMSVGFMSTLESAGYNLADGGSCPLTAPGDMVRSFGLPAVADNGGPTSSLLPAPGMLPIDAIPVGTEGLCDGRLATDQRGVARPFDGDVDGVSACDIGAVESTVTPSPIALVVESSADLPDDLIGDGLCRTEPSGDCSLRAAVQETNAWPTADAIAIDDGVAPVLTRAGTSEDDASTGDLDIRDEVVLDGNGAVVNANRRDRVFNVFGRATIRDLTIRGGGNGVDGAGVRNQGGQLLLERVTVTDNQGVNGGGIRNDNGGALDVVNSTVSGNRSTANGAGIYAASGETDIELTTITANSTGSGGALRGAGIFRVGGSAVGDQTGGLNCSGSIVSLGYNAVTNPIGCASATTGDGVVSSLQLHPLADNGGLTPTHMPRSGSPLRDRIAPGAATWCDGTHRTDQRGVDRPIDSEPDGAPECDTGAVEAPVDVRFVGAPVAAWTLGGPITLQGHPAGGTFAGTGVTGNVLDPSAGGTGNRTISYTYGGQTVTTVVEVFAASLNYWTSAEDDDHRRYTFLGTPPGGLYWVDEPPWGPRTIDGNSVVLRNCGPDFHAAYAGTHRGAHYEVVTTIRRSACPK